MRLLPYSKMRSYDLLIPNKCIILTVDAFEMFQSFNQGPKSKCLFLENYLGCVETVEKPGEAASLRGMVPRSS